MYSAKIARDCANSLLVAHRKRHYPFFCCLILVRSFLNTRFFSPSRNHHTLSRLFSTTDSRLLLQKYARVRKKKIKIKHTQPPRVKYTIKNNDKSKFNNNNCWYTCVSIHESHRTSVDRLYFMIFIQRRKYSRLVRLAYFIIKA